MTRHKSRVARRSRHRARRGTRKQSGGWSLSSLWPFGSKPADDAEAAPAAEAAPPVKQGFFSNLFGPKPNPTTPPTVTQNHDITDPPGTPQLGGRKTRHRRRRSPRRHRK